MTKKTWRRWGGAAVLTLGLCLMAVLGYWGWEDASSQAGEVTPPGAVALAAEQTVAFSPLLHWPENPLAVVYEMEIFTEQPTCLPLADVSPQAAFRTRAIYMNYFNPPLREIAADKLGKAPLYWRVRAIDFEGEPVGNFSRLQTLYTDASMPDMQAPVPLAHYGDGPGTTLLYPVYSWAGQFGAASYVVDIYNTNPAEHPEARPLAELTTPNFEIYDEKPRLGTYYWRVRALNAAKEPLGDWSAVSTIRTDPTDHWQVAVLGDSISHGGGHYSYNPADFAYSWLHYLDFDALNLSFSGDTAEMTAARFDEDVVPFQPHYLLVFTGTNSLRAGADPQAVIEDLREIRAKALANGIKPILLTLPPINPDAIAHVFGEETVPDWQWRFRVVNAYIRSQVHIDIAAVFRSQDGILAPGMALDGLHQDIGGKRLIGETVNKAWPRVQREADAQDR